MRSVDVAVDMLDKSIERGKKDPNYYMDYVKLHKLLYLAQCYLSFKYQKFHFLTILHSWKFYLQLYLVRLLLLVVEPSTYF